MARFTSLITGLLLATAATLHAGEDLSNIKWVTNDTDPPIGSDKALKGGTFYASMDAYPLTFRIVGPNSNDAFAGWNREFTQYFTLLRRHPVTDNFIPWMATHWAVQDDNKTVYYKLDPDARWSDGKPVTADDYVFTKEMLSSPHIVDPFYNKLMEDYFESVEKIDDYTIKIVGKQASWRVLSDYAFWPTPRHATKLTDKWVQETQLTPLVVAGPYTITEQKTGERVTFTRIKNWWGENKRYMKGLYNTDEIVLKVTGDNEKAFDFLKKGDISYYTINTARRWANEMNFEQLQKGYIRMKQLYVDTPQGIYGLAMNLQNPKFQNKDFRKALQYCFDFDTVNKQLMFDAYVRINSSFEGTEFANPNVKAYPFDPKKGREHLAKAGFTKRGSDGIFVNDKGQRASVTLTYGEAGLERHLTMIKENYKKLGIEVNLEKLEPATAFERGLERKYEMTIMSRTTNLYPAPHQYYATEFLKETNNNNIWYYGTPETDKLIDTYRFDLDAKKRIEAMHKLDEILNDEAFWIPFWHAPFMRFAYWDYVAFPDTYFPKRTEQYLDWHVWWIDPQKKSALEAAMKAGQALPKDEVVVMDPWGVMGKAPSAPATEQ